MENFSFIDVEDFIPVALKYMNEQNANCEVSNYIKTHIYGETFDVQFRPKYTGFEKIPQTIDKKYRDLATAHLAKLRGSPVPQRIETATRISDIDTNTDIWVLIDNYKNSLISQAQSYKTSGVKPVIYYSGGVDSEVVLKAFLEAGTPFHVVTFLLTVNRDFTEIDGEFYTDADPQILDNIPETELIINWHDAKYSLEFCKTHNIHQNLRIFNVLNFWKSRDFLISSDEHNISSPQILSQRYMSKLLENEVKNLGIKSLDINPIIYYDIDYG